MKYSVEELDNIREDMADKVLIDKLKAIGAKPVFENPIKFIEKEKNADDYEVLIVTQQSISNDRIRLDGDSFYLSEPVITKKVEDEAIDIILDAMVIAKVTSKYAVIEFLPVQVMVTSRVHEIYSTILNTIVDVKKVGVSSAKKEIAKRNLKEKLEMNLKRDIQELEESYIATKERQEMLMTSLYQVVEKRDTYSKKLKLLKQKQDVSVDKLLKDLDETTILKNYEITDSGYIFEFNHTDITDLEGNKFKGTEYTVNVSNTGYIRFNCPEEDKVDCYWSNGPTCHPHIDESGNACFGEIGASISTALAEADLVSAVYMLHAYLSSANETDMAGEYITEWELLELSDKAKQRKVDYIDKVKEISEGIVEKYQKGDVEEVEQFILDNIEVSSLYRIGNEPASKRLQEFVSYEMYHIERLIGYNKAEEEEKIICKNCNCVLDSYAETEEHGVVDGDNLFCSIECYTEWEEI